MQKITYEDFLTSVRESKLKLNNLVAYYEPVAKFYYDRKQTDYFRMSGFDVINSSDLNNILDSFGIFTTDLISVNYNRILYVDPTKDLIKQYSEQSNLMACVPSHIVILSEDSDVINNVLNSYREQGIEFKSMQVFEDKNIREKSLERIPESISRDKLIDVTDFCMEMSMSKLNNYDKIVKFDNFIDELHRQIHEDSGNRKIPVCLGGSNLSPQFAEIAIELFVRYGDKFYCDDEVYCNVITNEITKTCVSLTDTYKHDLFNSLNNLPRLLVKKDLIGNIYNLLGDTKIGVRLTYTDIDCEEDPKTEYFDVKKLKYFDIVKEFNLNSIEGCVATKHLIMDLYDALDMSDRNIILSVTDLVLFEKNGIKYVGYVEDVNFEAKSYNYIPGLKDNKEVTIRFEDLLSHVGLGVFLNGNTIFKTIVKSSGLDLGSTTRINMLSPKRKLLEYLRNADLPVNTITDLYNNRVVDLSTLGLACKIDSLARRSFNKVLVKSKGMDYVRDNVDCFGGYNPVLVRRLDI